MVENLEDAVLILEDAKRIRDDYKANPDPEAYSDTEESVIAALLRADITPIEVLRLKKIYTRALRIILKADVDQQR